MRDRLEHDDEFRRKLYGQHRLFTGRKLDILQRERFHLLRQILFRQIGAGRQVDLAEIFHQRQFMWSVGGNLAYAWTDGECYLDHLVEGWRIALGAQRASIFVLLHGFQRGVGVEHAAAAGAQNIPGDVEDAHARCMQKGADGAFLVEAILAGEGQRIDAAKLAVLARGDGLLDRLDCLRIDIGRLPQK